jgi:hypothetical protein
MQNCDNQRKFNEADDCTTQSREDVLNSNIQLKNKFSALQDQLKAGFHGRFFSAKCEIFRLFLLNCEQSSRNNVFE